MTTEVNELLEKATDVAGLIGILNDEVLAKHIQRTDVVKATWLALVSGRLAFFLGSPGVDKTGTIQEMAKRINGAVFYDALMPTIVSAEQLLVESTSIEEVPTVNGGKQIRTKDQLGRAALAHILFADEIWKSEAMLLQTLLDLSKGDGVRHEGQMQKTPLMAFLAASNELPESEGNLGAIWSRMTIRVQVNPLDRTGKTSLVKARLARDRDRTAKKTESVSQLTLDDIEILRQARVHVEVPDEIVEIVLSIYEELLNDNATDFQWLWDDDRRFGRVFDIMQANALLSGRTRVTKADLTVLEWMLWDTPEQIATVKSKIAPYCRTPLGDAKELLDALLSPSGAVVLAKDGNRDKSTQAATQCDETLQKLGELKNEATGTEVSEIEAIIAEVSKAKTDAVMGAFGLVKGGN